MENDQEEDQPPAEPTNLERAEAVAKRIETANAEHLKLIERQEALKVEDVLGGQSDAGRPAEKPAEETPEEYAKKAIAGDLNG